MSKRPSPDSPEYALARTAQAGAYDEAKDKDTKPVPTEAQVEARKQALEKLKVLGERTISYYKRICTNFGMNEADALAQVHVFFIDGVDSYNFCNPYFWSHVQTVIFNRLRTYTKRTKNKLDREVTDLSQVEFNSMALADTSMLTIDTILLAKAINTFAQQHLSDTELDLLRWIVDEGGTVADWATLHDEDPRAATNMWSAIRRKIEKGVGSLER